MASATPGLFSHTPSCGLSGWQLRGCNVDSQEGMSRGDLGAQARHFRRTFATIRPEEYVCGLLPFAQLVLEFPEPSGHYAHANLREHRNTWPSSIRMGGMVRSEYPEYTWDEDRQSERIVSKRCAGAVCLHCAQQCPLAG